MNTISGRLENAGEAIEQKFDDDFEDIQELIKEVRHLRMQASKNSDHIARQMKQIEHLERLVNPVPPLVRIRSDDTVDFNNYKPQHPMFQRAAAQPMSRRLKCWLTQPKDKKAKQEKLIQEYYGDKTTEKRREEISKNQRRN